MIWVLNEEEQAPLHIQENWRWRISTGRTERKVTKYFYFPEDLLWQVNIILTNVQFYTSQKKSEKLEVFLNSHGV